MREGGGEVDPICFENPRFFLVGRTFKIKLEEIKVKNCSLTARGGGALRS
jgi:hypothetical protein